VGVSSDTYPHRLASVTCRPNHTETNAPLTCRHGRGPLGGGVLRGGPCPQPPRPSHDRGSGWEAGPPCLLGAGSKAWGGLPIARLENPSRVELQSNPSGGALDTCDRAWGGAITTRRPLYSERLRGRSGIRRGSVERHYIRETGQPRSGWYSFRGGYLNSPTVNGSVS
jgi:hypothetical protein